MSDIKTTGEQLSVSEQLERLRLQKETLELEDLTMRVETERSRRAFRKLNQQRQQQSLEQFNRDVAARQAKCKHKMGGKNLPGIENGTSSKFAILTHTYPWGETVCMCTRCHKEWRPPKQGEANFEQKLAAYRWALEAPTDNEPSGNRIFLIEDHRKFRRAPEEEGQSYPGEPNSAAEHAVRKQSRSRKTKTASA